MRSPACSDHGGEPCCCGAERQQLPAAAALSYAPLAATWGHDNRTVALRVPSGPPEARRIEHRVAGADASPYLVLAAVLAGIHHGL